MILSGLREINFLNLFVAFDEMLLKKKIRCTALEELSRWIWVILAAMRF